MAKLYFRYGAMNCGKSTALIQVAYNYRQNNKKVLIFKPKIDTKGGKCIESRIGVKALADYLIDSNDNVYNIFESLNTNDISCILVDESQFLLENQIEDLWKICKLKDIPVICYGIKNNYKGELFTGSKRLCELSDELEELITICSCGKRAKFSARFVNNKFMTTGDTIVIDGKKDDVKYVPMCGKCFLNEIIKSKEGE